MPSEFGWHFFSGRVDFKAFGFDAYIIRAWFLAGCSAP